MPLSTFGLGGGSPLSSHPHLHRLPPLHRWWAAAGARNPRTTPAALVLVVCVAAPAAYLALAKRSLARRTEARPARVRPSRSGSAKGDDGEGILAGALVSLPDEVMASEADAGVVLARETVCSLPFPVASLKPEFFKRRSGPGLGLDLDVDAGTGAGAGEGVEVSEVDKDAVVSTFLRTSMRLFTRTPQAVLMRRLMPRGEESFEAPYLDACAFAVGDRVCGVYVVAERRAADGAAVLRLSPPEGWSGPRPEGVLVIAVVEDRDGAAGAGAGKLRLVSETVLWRRADDTPTVLESRVGAWLHELMVRWFVVRAVDAVTA
ncbi:hypothetical protein DL769_009194 [Monosporascus sp. CRB-8-3]|nr:hypothetical protein DL769_009194 [Monosporascus sp. CRB-8-3]